MKLPWVLKYSFRQIFGDAKGRAIVAWLEGPAGAALDQIEGGKIQGALDKAETAILTEVERLTGGVKL